VDRVLPGRIENQLHLLCAGALIAGGFYTVFSCVRSLLLIRLEARVDSHLMLGFLEHLLALPFRFFQQRGSGDLLMRLGSNAAIREALASYTISTLLDGALVVVYLIALIRTTPQFAAVAAFFGALQIAILLATSRRLECLAESDISTQSESQNYLVQVLAGVGTVKASGAEDRILDRWSSLLGKQIDASAARGRYAAAVESAMTGIRTLSPLCLLWLGSLDVLAGTMSLGTMLAANALAASFLLPLASLVSSAQRVQLARAHLERIGDVLRAAPEQDPLSVRAAPRLTGRIELRDVSFRYDANGPLILRNISLEIAPSQKVAIVGRTGSGKSTLAKLLLGMYAPTEGEIRYDGLPLTELNLRSVRRQWGAVLQESFVFSGSVRENIAFDNPALGFEDLAHAARIAAIEDDIASMPMGFETPLDEGGSSFSGGQRQRLALARAVAHQPALLLLDEATSHLDAVTERLVESNLDALACTRIVVAHRLSTVRNADVILVLDDGVIVEQGAHDQLMELGGHYAALVRNQTVSLEFGRQGCAAHLGQ
jgi:ABC-type bacteriocin/lantibiotic exporter with double-glycine peptidase domain